MAYDRFLDVEGHIKDDKGTDPLTGMRYEHWDVGMVRNASEASKKRLKVFLDPSPHVILDQGIPLRGWYKAKVEPKGVRPRPCYTEAFLTSPYGGTCPVRCQFCYVNNGGRGYRGQGLTVVDPQYPAKIEKQLKKLDIGFPVYISSFTEPFQPLEDIYHITQQLGDIVVNKGLPLFYLTRMITPDWAIEHLLNSKYSYLQNSIITPDSGDYHKFSPNCPSLDDLLARMREIHNLGIYVSVQINPINLGIVSKEQIVELIHLLAKNGADHVIFKFVELVSPAAPELVRRYTKIFPERVELFASNFNETIGGMRTINEKTRLQCLDLFKIACAKAGVTMGLCYEYGFGRDAAGNVTNKAGVSLGREYCTADQCHGKRTPLHIKNNEGLFEPFEACPPSGCLYCQETCGQETAPCGSQILFEAKALGSADYNKIIKEMITQ